MLPDTEPGAILLWHGTLLNIPSGWHLCDGTSGTPDLRDQFVVEAGDTYAVDDTGGAVTHPHDFTGDTHQHNVAGGSDIQFVPQKIDRTDFQPATGTTDAGNVLPTYYSLAYIMAL